MSNELVKELSRSNDVLEQAVRFLRKDAGDDTPDTLTSPGGSSENLSVDNKDWEPETESAGAESSPAEPVAKARIPIKKGPFDSPAPMGDMGAPPPMDDFAAPPPVDPGMGAGDEFAAMEDPMAQPPVQPEIPMGGDAYMAMLKQNPSLQKDRKSVV